MAAGGITPSGSVATPDQPEVVGRPPMQAGTNQKRAILTNEEPSDSPLQAGKPP